MAPITTAGMVLLAIAVAAFYSGRRVARSISNRGPGIGKYVGRVKR